MRFGDIPIRVEGEADGDGFPAAGRFADAGALTGETQGLGGGVAALLAELAALLERLAAERAPAAIDLKSLPMGPDDRRVLERMLGEGEVQATVRADGLTTLRETRLAGVWWVEHRDAHGQLLAELIEVTPVPAFLSSGTDDIAAAAQMLRNELRRGHDGTL